MNTYGETVEWLYEQLPMFSVIGPGAYKPGLGTAHMLDDAFGNPHHAFKTIHVAGTNGKGSTSHALASVLMEVGYKVGLYTSPHLVDFRERIRVNGQKISEEAVVDFVNRYQGLNLDCQPSFFELTTIMAFDYFAQQGVDVAVIETGLGGRLDTTNIITPLISVITNVSLDHTALLGNTEEEIAAEKAGIIKPGVPVVVSEAQGGVREVFAAKARAEGAPIVFAEDSPVSFRRSADGYEYQLPDGRWAASDLHGEWQPKNINAALHALEILGIADCDTIARGLASVCANTGLMGRWMKIASSPETVCDTGHNIGAWRYLAPRLTAIAAQRPVRVILGFASDKDADSIFALLPKNACYYLAAPNVKRARSVDSLMGLAKSNGLEATAFNSVPEAYAEAVKESSPDDFVFVGGSNFVVSEIL